MEPETSPGVKPPPEKSVCTEAHEIVHGARRESYGTPAENHGRTAALWSAYLGVPITARQVCILNVLQKVSRDAHRPKRDNLVDIAGYAENADLVDADVIVDVIVEHGPGTRRRRCPYSAPSGWTCLLAEGHRGPHMG